MYKVVMFGARDWHRRAPVNREILKLKKKHGANKLLIIEGEAPGADQMCRVIAESHDIHVARVAALWGTRHRGAGPQRNDVMLALEPDEGIGFHEDIKNSKGTKDMFNKLRKTGVPARIVTK